MISKFRANLNLGWKEYSWLTWLEMMNVVQIDILVKGILLLFNGWIPKAPYTRRSECSGILPSEFFTPVEKLTLMNLSVVFHQMTTFHTRQSTILAMSAVKELKTTLRRLFENVNYRFWGFYLIFFLKILIQVLFK